MADCFEKYNIVLVDCGGKLNISNQIDLHVDS